MYNAASDVDLDVADGDNEVYPAGVPGLESRLTCPGCAPGETPVGYRAVNLLADQFSYEGRQLALAAHHMIGGLTPGKRYAVTVSALNERGQGKRAVATPALLITPPLTVPSPPTGVTVAVKTWGVTASPNDMLGDSQRLIVTYAPPLSNGGTAVTAYRVELDPTPTFDNPIVEDFDCPSRPDYSTWVVKTAATVGDTIASGSFFTLQLQHNGQTRVTNPIPYNAVALAVQESHNPTFVSDIFISPVTCVQDATATAGICPGSRQPISGSMQMRLNMLGILGDGVDVS
eukprot:19143-Heterococcus_DN1.PRE.1